VRPRFPLIVVLSLLAARASAQTPERVPSAPVRIGPLELYPTLALTNFGLDNNVFNEPNQAAPKRDFTITLTPATDLRLRLGRARLTGTVKEDFVYYQTYANQRSANMSLKGGLQSQLNRVILKGGASYLSTNERPGFEIDVRSQRYEAGVNGSVEIRILPKTFVGLRGDQTSFDYDENAVFLDSNLHNTLSRTTTAGSLTVRYRITPLTSFTVDAGLEHDRFEFSPLRDSDSTRVVAGVRFEPRALLKGSAAFGYRDFQPLSPDTAPYRGSVAAVDLTTALGPTKLALQGNRDVQYSYDLNQPYYVQTAATGSITQHIVGSVDMVGRLGVARLDYQNRIVTGLLLPLRTDYVHSFGGGLGYRMARRTRIGFNVDESRRTSGVALRQYDGLTIGTSVTYGF
jgi:putative beta-barrel porin BBP2